MARSNGWRSSADDWRQPYPDWPGTRYEAKALREGRQPAYLTFVSADTTPVDNNRAAKLI